MCTPGQCVECNGSSQVQIDCPLCEQLGCEDCNKTGFIRIDGCPKKYVGREVNELMPLADLYRKGLPPVAGGSLDQASVFVESCLCLWSTESRLRIQLGITDGSA